MPARGIRDQRLIPPAGNNQPEATIGLANPAMPVNQPPHPLQPSIPGMGAPGSVAPSSMPASNPAATQSGSGLSTLLGGKK